MEGESSTSCFCACYINLYADFYILRGEKKGTNIDFWIFFFFGFLIPTAKKNYSVADCVSQKKKEQFFRQNGEVK